MRMRNPNELTIVRMYFIS